MEYQARERRQKHLDYGHGIKNYVPYWSTTSSGTQGQVTGGNTLAQNTYSPGQQQLQGNLGNLWQSFLSGNIPSSFTNPQAAINAYNTNFQTSVAPGMAAQYGAGSPAIGSANALGLAQLQGQLYNTGVNNFLGALGGGTNYALGMPTGQQGSYGSQAAGQYSGTQTSQINPLALLAGLYNQVQGSVPLVGSSANPGIF
jgi:hypothetical protein